MIFRLLMHRMESELSASVDGDVLVLNGVSFDFSVLQDGDLLPKEAISSRWIGPGGVERIGGEVSVHLIVPYGRNAPEETYDPPATLEVSDGPVPLPIHGGSVG